MDKLHITGNSLFTDEELENLRREALAEQSSSSSDSFYYEPGDDKESILWEDGESSDLFRGGNEFWEIYPTVN